MGCVQNVKPFYQISVKFEFYFKIHQIASLLENEWLSVIGRSLESLLLNSHKECYSKNIMQKLVAGYVSKSSLIIIRLTWIGYPMLLRIHSITVTFKYKYRYHSCSENIALSRLSHNFPYQLKINTRE